MFERRLSTHAIKLFSQYPILTIMGPRQSGKTTLARLSFPELAYVSLEDPDNREFALSDPRGFVAQYPDGAILDEIQKTPDLTSYLQGIVDEANKPGMYVLTGSQNFTLSHTVSQSLAGRTAILQLLPLSLSEIGFSYQRPSTRIDKEIQWGFYPRLRNSRSLLPNQYYADYFQTYVQRDIRDLAEIRNVYLFERFIKLCAGRVGQLLNINSLANDAGITRSTAEKWLGHLEASYIVFRLQPFYRNIGKRLVKSPKLYFYDVGFTSYLLGIQRPEHLHSHPLRGSLFENLVIADLVKQMLNHVVAPNLYFYRDSNGNEVDCVQELGTGFRLFEIKSGQTIASDYFDGISRFKKSLQILENDCESYVIYGGNKTSYRHNTNVITLSESATLLDNDKQ